MTTPTRPLSYRPAAPPRPGQVVTMVLLGILVFVGALAVGVGFFVSAFVLDCHDACRSRSIINEASGFGMIAAVVISVGAFVLSVARMKRQQNAWWVPAAAMVLLVAVEVVAVVVAGTGV